MFEFKLTLNIYYKKIIHCMCNFPLQHNIASILLVEFIFTLQVFLCLFVFVVILVFKTELYIAVCMCKNYNYCTH